MLDTGYLSVAQQQQLLRDGVATPVDLVAAALRRIDSVQPILNCFVRIWGDEAIARAATIDTTRLGPLTGIPVVIKDTTPWAGHGVSYGSRTFAGNVATNTAIIVEKLLAAGAIIVASTNTPEFAHTLITDNPLWGATKNPWDLSRSPGGSSGGSGAAVASGCVALAEGSDMGGSVRIPAAWCGIVGLKPSLGRIPMNVLPSLFDTLSHHGPLGRCVDDVRRFLCVTQGPDIRDPWSTLAPLDYSHPLPADIVGLRIGLSLDYGTFCVLPEIRHSVEQMCAQLENQGAIVETVDLDFTTEFNDAWLQMWGIFMATHYGHLTEVHAQDMDKDVLELIELGRKLQPSDAKHIEAVRTELWKRVANVFATCDVIICPTTAQAQWPATKEECWKMAPPPVDGRVHDPTMTEVWNLASPCPVVAVPSGKFVDGDHLGLPIGLQVVGKPGCEDVVLNVASVIERITGSLMWRPL